jgi:hypothetical protein
MLVGLLTIEQKDILEGQYFAEDQMFNPVQDTNGDWIISTTEMYNCINVDYMWVQELPLIEWTGSYMDKIEKTDIY